MSDNITSKRVAELPVERVRMRVKKPRTNLSKSISNENNNSINTNIINNDNEVIINNINENIIDTSNIDNIDNKTQKETINSNNTKNTENINQSENDNINNNTKIHSINLSFISNKIDTIILEVLDILTKSNKLTINEITVKIAHNHNIDNIIKLYKRILKEDLVYININIFNYFIVLLKILIRTRYYINTVNNTELNNTILINLYNILINLVTYNEYITTNVSNLVLRHTSNKLLIDNLNLFNNELFDLSQALMEFNYSNDSIVTNNIITNIKNTSVELFNLSCLSSKNISNLLIDLVTLPEVISKN